MPIPPSQWVRLRQNRRERGSTSMSVRIDAPVVVNPLIDSKIASSTAGIAPETTNGRQPSRPPSIQVAATINSPSLRCSCPSTRLPASHSTVPSTRLTAMDAPKPLMVE